MAWEMFSKPMKAQGEITAIRTIWDRALLSGTKAGAKRGLPSSAEAKQITMPAVKRSTRPMSTAMVAFRRRLHSSPVSSRAAMDSSASPRYTS